MSESIDKPARLRDRVMQRAREIACETTTSETTTSAPARDAGTREHGTDGEALTPPPSASNTTIGTSVASAPPSSSPCPPEWYSIGSSDIAALMGTSPHSSAVDVWARLVHGVETADAAHMTAGKEAERWILARWEKRTGFTTRDEPTTRVEIRGVPVRAQRDAVEIALGGTVEIKAPTRHTQPWTYSETVPPWHWRDQVIWQLGVASAQGRVCDAGAWIVAEWGYHDGDRREWFVPWDDAAKARFAEQVAMAVDCWQAWIVEGWAPEPRTAAEQAMIARLAYPRVAQPVIVPATADEAAMLTEAIAASDTEKAANGYSESVRAKVMATIGDREGIESDTVRATWRANKKGVRTLLVKRTGEAADEHS